MAEELFSDLNINFKAHPVTGNLYMVKDKDSIKQSVKNLILTNKYEVLFDSNCFSNVTYSLFENMDSSDLVFLKNNIESVLLNYEGRCQVQDIRYKDDLDNNGFYITIIYLPVNSVTTDSVDVFLERLR